MAKLLLLLCAAVASINAQCSVERAQPMLGRSIYEFSVNLVQRLAQDSEYHFVSSPLSAWTLLASASLGAADETLDELRTVLRLHRNRCFNNKYLEIARAATSVDEPDVFLERSSVIFADEEYQISSVFKGRLARSQISRVEEISFENLENAATNINEFVRAATRDAVEEVVAPGDLDNAVMVMVDALFFRGAWTHQFSEADTEVSAFYDGNDQVGDVNLMYNLGKYNITFLAPTQAQVIEIPYGESRRFSMLVFLPLKNATVATVIDGLQSVSLHSIRRELARGEPELVALQLPRFKITSDLSNMKELLMDMGLRAPFDVALASFPDMSDQMLYVSSLLQKSEIEVNEQGATASAASAAEFSSRMGPVQFTANRPFLFMIVDNLMDIPIFTGAFSKPSLTDI